MDVTMKQWIVGAILIVIVVIVIDGIRRMRNARRDSLHMSLKVKNGTELDIEDENYGSEFPNGGARPSQNVIDKQRIDKLKNQYDYGRNLSKESNSHDPLIVSKPSAHYEKERISTEQWVDSDENDEEYYAEKWDDDSVNELSEHDLADEKIDSVALGDGDLGDGEYRRDRKLDHTSVASMPLEETIEEELKVHSTGFSEDDVEGHSLEKHNAEKHNVVPDVEKFPPVARHQHRGNKSPYQQPEQVPLNLEESVPVLMESVVETSEHENIDSVESGNTIESINENSMSNVDQLKESESANIRPVGKSIKPTAETKEGEEDNLDTHSANKPRYESKYFSKNTSTTLDKVNVSNIQEVLVVNVRAPKGHLFYGSDLLQQVLDTGLRYGAMEVFHRHADEDGEGPVVFSMANMLKPGTFDLKTIDEFSTAGVTLFLTLPVFNNNNMAAFDLMIATAKHIAENLGGELNDENRSVMTGQTIEHYRERIRDFSRRQQLEKKR
ncbi:MAG: cell division protein ZipA [Candidatus Endobugula sp.]|jgi:cell division protein ZipA